MWASLPLSFTQFLCFLWLVAGKEMTETSQETSKQLVLYEQLSFLKPFSQETRHFDLTGKTWFVRQDWNQLGVAGVIWEAVRELTNLLILPSFSVSQVLILSHYLESHPELIKVKKVIELGGGTGPVSVIAATLGKWYQLYSIIAGNSGEKVRPQ